MNDTISSKRKVGLGPVGETRKGLKNSQGPTFMLIGDCEIKYNSDSLKKVLDHKLKNNCNWSKVYECYEVRT